MIPKTEIGKSILVDIPLKEIIPLINWKMFFHAWKIQGKYLETFPYTLNENQLSIWLKTLNLNEKIKAKESIELFSEASEILNHLNKNHHFDGKGLVRFEKAWSDKKNIYIGNQIFPMLRQQRRDSEYLSTCDFLESNNSFIGLFAVSAGHYLEKYAKETDINGDTYKALIIQTLSDRIAEASAEWLQNMVSNKYWPVSIRPAWGYPMLPDQTLILQTKVFLPYEKIGIELTENGAMYPPSSISGLYISHPKAKYFMVGEIGNDQLEDYSRRRGISLEKTRGLLRQI